VSSVRRRGRRVRISLTLDEIAILLDLFGQIIVLLGHGDHPGEHADGTMPEPGERDDADIDTELLERLLDTPAEIEPPTDPVLRRLLPDGYRNDDNAAGEFRRLTEGSLRATKRSAVQRVVDDLTAAVAGSDHDGEVQLELKATDAEEWLPAFTDLRLALGTRIGVTEDVADELATVPPGTARHAELETYDWITWLQNAIVLAVLR